MWSKILPFAAGLALLAPAARADAIDGNWCSADRRLLTIQGPQIVTPGGARMEGSYTRHGFSYVVPAQEPGGGQTAVLTLVNDQLVRYVLQGATSEWKRCAPPTS